MFHLPHNAVIPEEVEFIIDLIDENQEYYFYDDLKALVFEEEIKKNKFEIFHAGMYKNYNETSSLKPLYDGIKDESLSYNDIKRIAYTENKNINGVWNEIVRDYFEFFAFTGLMPSYYKGSAKENEKRYYIGETLKQYKSGNIDYKDVLLRMKHRNASKNFSSFTQQYDIRNRPFVVALKLMNIFKQKGFKEIDGNTISYYVKSIKDEDKINEIDIKPILKEDFTANEFKEIGRGTTFLRQHLVRGLGIVDLATSAKRPCVFDLTQFDINNYNFKDKAIFIGDIFEATNRNIELTPSVFKSICNPSSIQDFELKEDLKELGLIDDIQPLCDFNIDTDLMSRDLVELFLKDSIIQEDNTKETSRVELTPEYREGKEISSGSNGAAYEEFINSILVNKFGEDNVNWFGSKTTGQRLSDITCNIKVKGLDGEEKFIKIIVESKAGSAIKAFDERKEVDDIANTLALDFDDSYAGVWYIVVDSDKIPTIGEHGGFRNQAYQKSFKSKLIQIHKTIVEQIWRPTLVTAFSYDEFMKFIYAIKYNRGCVTQMQTPNFWTWSNLFMRDSYVSVIV